MPEKKEIDVLSPERYEEVHEGLQCCQLNVFQPFWESVKKIPFPYFLLSMKTEKGAIQNSLIKLTPQITLRRALR